MREAAREAKKKQEIPHVRRKVLSIQFHVFFISFLLLLLSALGHGGLKKKAKKVEKQHINLRV